MDIKNSFEEYLKSISSKFTHDETSEMGYRADLEKLLKDIFISINVERIDHDARSKEGNKPDFVVYNHQVPILYIEAKNIGLSLDKIEKSEQMARYYGYTNLVLTDYTEFRFYRNGEKYNFEPIKIAQVEKRTKSLVAKPENFEFLAKTLIDFSQSQKEPLKSGKHLAKIMGGRAQRIRDNIKQFLSKDSVKNEEILNVYETIKKQLVHDLSIESFADMYAQTLVYGLFVARFNDETKENFTRQEARELVPASNPLLRHFFDHIVGPDFDKRLGYIVNELCEIFSHADVEKLMQKHYKTDLWGESHEGPDPVIHFYEDFLKEYDSDLRKKIGAFYTPLPVVRFMVRSVDYLLEKEFGLARGLADNSKINEIHRIQVLDPATGTGTFLSEVIESVYKKFENQKGAWPSYVQQDLLPRLYGFELMMGPYTIAHLKLGIRLKETGFKYFNKSRLGIYLTNSLEAGFIEKDLFSGLGFAQSIAEEAKEASKIKNDKPIMVVLGNPPYSVSSSNKGEWIQNLIKVYKKDLNERNIQPLSDDYIKFIRFAEHFIEKNKTGIVAMITNNSFLSGIIHRQMRKHLLETFDKIYILDLHGNSNVQEVIPNNNKDENVFDIQQGVSINIFVRQNGNKTKLGSVYHSELFGNRKSKFEILNNLYIEKFQWQQLDYSEPYFFFAPKDFTQKDNYEKGFKIDEMFMVNTSGVKTHHDKDLVSFEKIDKPQATKYLYRPFDFRYINYDLKKVVRHRYEVMKNVLNKYNLSLITSRQFGGGKYFILLCSNIIHDISSQAYAAYYNFPLYLYDDNGIKTSNLNERITEALENIVGKTAPEDIFDYIYAALHSQTYREKYKEFLKIDFPRVPYPKNKKQFDALVVQGRKLREVHLLESPLVNNFGTTFNVLGENKIENKFPLFKEAESLTGHPTKSGIYINEQQFFGPKSINLEELKIVWNFYIGGYQPAQKWLKDRRGRILNNEDIEHYQKIIVALVETDRIMKEIDKIYG